MAAPWLWMPPTMRPSPAGARPGRHSCDNNHTSLHDTDRGRYASPTLPIDSTKGQPRPLAAMDARPASTAHQPVMMEGCGDHEGCVIRARTRWSHRGRIFALAARPSWLALVLLVLAVASPAAAVLVEFDNCLPDSYRLNNPPLLQWVPLYVNAVFDTKTPNNNLQVIVWGNVTGSQNLGTLPPPNDPYWQNPNETNGKIDETPYSDTLATTLVRRVNVLTYEPWNDRTNFCTNDLVNGTCPLAPTFGNV